MQHSYVGDIGDYLKLSLLNALQEGNRLGVAWWLFYDEKPKADGRHIGYLSDRARWRKYDPEVFDLLLEVVANERNVSGLEVLPFLSWVRFSAEVVPKGIADRKLWLLRMVDTFSDRNIVFFDPDNGLAPPGFRPGASNSGKSIELDEIKMFRKEGRTLVVYHHQTRFKGGHQAEIRHWATQLPHEFRRVDVVRCRPWSPRLYFILDASDDLIRRTEALVDRWDGHMAINPHLSQPRHIAMSSLE